MDKKKVEDVMKELQGEVTGKINFRFKKVNTEEFEKGMKFVDRVYCNAFKKIQKKLGIQIFKD